MKTKDLKRIMTGLISRVTWFREERPFASRSLQLEVFAMDASEITAILRSEVLERVRHEAVLDADVDIDYLKVSDEVRGLMVAEIPEKEPCQEQYGAMNEALQELADVSQEIADQLDRRHTNEEYVRLYERELKVFIRSRDSYLKRKFERWLDDVCLNQLTMDDLLDYRAERLLKLFGSGVFVPDVEHMQRGTKYQDDIPLDHIDLRKLKLRAVSPDELRSDLSKHYRSLRKIVNLVDGLFVVMPQQAGHYFFSHRHDFDASARLGDFLKYMRQIELVQAEIMRLREKKDPLSELSTSRQDLFGEIERLIARGDWTKPATEERICTMMRNVLGVGRVSLSKEEQVMSETLWSLLEGAPYLEITWLNLVGYFSGHGLLNSRHSSPQLCRMFFDNDEKYQNVNKGRPTFPKMSKKYRSIQPLLDKFRP